MIYTSIAAIWGQGIHLHRIAWICVCDPERDFGFLEVARGKKTEIITSIEIIEEEWVAAFGFRHGFELNKNRPTSLRKSVTHKRMPGKWRSPPRTGHNYGMTSYGNKYLQNLRGRELGRVFRNQCNLSPQGNDRRTA